MYHPPSPPPRLDRGVDYANSLPDECLALIFTFLTTTNDRNISSLVSRRWLQIEAQTRTHLSLNAKSDLHPFIPSIFTRFNSLTHLVLRNNDSISINDDDMILITSMSPNLTRLKISECEQLTDSGMAVFTKNCKELKEFSCAYCRFSDLGMFELLDNCCKLEVLHVKRSFDKPGVGARRAKFRAGGAVNTLKVIKLTNVFNERLFTPLISCCKNLKSLKMIWCGGKMGRALEKIRDDNCLAEVYLDNVNVSDVGVSSLAKCRDLIELNIKSSRCTDVGLISIAENCRALKKLYVGHYLFRNEIGDEGLIALGKHCVNLEELVLIGVNATYVSLEVIAANCQNLVRLELCHIDTITDVELMCIVEKCVALKILRIEECGVSNNGIEALGLGCPNLVNLNVIKCRKVTREVGDLLREKRGSLVVKVDAYETKVVNRITLELVSTRSRPSENGG
ncbi:VIER F-box protein 2 [Artemisia annua]|uniref:VIER F-box protein 2 n=1 Tax=Artemisia annua TaxID=35608 RepID=A0A2U1MGD0_ARTAN|nr:VIER F-box protein 2 [Artemisia annua]